MQVSPQPPVAPAAPSSLPAVLGAWLPCFGRNSLAAEAPAGALAQPDYGALQGLEGAKLLTGLGALVKAGHVDRGYGASVSELFARVADPDGDNQVLDAYTGKTVHVASKWGGWARGLSVEHTWPRSHGATGIANGDLHHLHVAGRAANQIRSNNPFGEIASSTWSSKGTAAGRSERGLDAAGSVVFEPADSVKGDIARSLLYFATRYGSDAPAKYDATGFRSSLATLLKWHEADPVTDAERARNDAVQAFQGNRNPYVDLPELAARVGATGFGA
ncbi:MAG: hypothetical protein JWM90_2304 [Thermoleophilia bacterium]|nr:hypothetical protein [Thermoleophilia bacterium]